MAIFLSYSRQDEAAVKALVEGFETARRQVWYDTHDLSAGDIWWPKILENIRAASVFVFALSDTSVESKACLAELDYALALGKPIIPVQVGELLTIRGNPLAKMHLIVYRPDDANSGFEVLSTVVAAAAKDGPLPDPLPPEPPIPYAYLLALGTQIESAEVDPTDQATLVEQLRKAINEETDDTVHQEIMLMLRRFMARPWVTKRTEKEIKALLFANTDETEVAPAADQRAPEKREEALVEPDGRAIFEDRMAKLRQRELARSGAENRASNVWEPVTPEPLRFPGVTGVATSIATGDTMPAASGPAPHEPQSGPLHPPEPPHSGPQNAFQPPPTATSFAQSAIPVPPGAPPAQTPLPASPPRYWGLSIVSFVLNLLIGAIAMYFSYQVGQRYGAGDYGGAVQASRNARIWAIVGIAVGCIVYLSILTQVR